MTYEGLTIRTPEGIAFSLPLASPASRMLALVIDLLVIMAASSVISKALQPLVQINPDIVQATGLMLYFAVSLLYGILTEWLWRGQTLGKRMLGLRVIDSAGLRLEPSQIIVRNVLRFVDGLPGLYLVGGIVCVLNSRRQRLGDIAAGTVVIRVADVRRPDLDQVLGSKYNSLAAYRHLSARLRQRVSPELASIALEALIRRDRFDPLARLAVFAELAAHFRSIVEFPAEAVEQLADEQYVRNVVEILFRAAQPAVAASTRSSYP